MKICLAPIALLVGLPLHAGATKASFFATAEIVILDRTLVTSDSASDGEAAIPQAEVQNELEVITSSAVLELVVKRLKLDRVSTTEGGSITTQQAVDRVRQKLKVAPDPKKSKRFAQAITITATSDSARGAADLANAVADSYKTLRDDAERQLDEQGMAVLRDQVSQQKQVVKDAEAKANQYPQNADLEKQSQVSQNMLQALRNKLQQDEKDMKLVTSPVQILSRAVPPPE